jgi:uncharacterized protein (DUF2062 family)
MRVKKHYNMRANYWVGRVILHKKYNIYFAFAYQHYIQVYQYHHFLHQVLHGCGCCGVIFSV